jgi:hypothetical protein
VEKRLPQYVARDRRQLLFLLLDCGDLDFFLTRDRFFRHGRVQQYVRKQFDTQLHIGLGDFDRKIEAVVAGIARNRAPTASIWLQFVPRYAFWFL